MSVFQPARASPRPSPRIRQYLRIPNLTSVDTTITSATSSVSAALSGLSPKDVELIDEIIDRSPPSSTTFLTVFKAYSEVLTERGMDVENDVMYYKILLKLGVVKGNDWGTKWRFVKEQQGYVDARDEETTPPTSPDVTGGIHLHHQPIRDEFAPMQRYQGRKTRPPYSGFHLPAHARDAVTVHSHQDDDTEVLETETGLESGLDTEYGTDRNREQTYFYSPPTTLVTRDRGRVSKEDALGLSTDLSSYPPLPTMDQFLPVQAKKLQSIHGSEFSSDVLTRNSSPPPPRLLVGRKPLQPIRPPNADPATRVALKPATRYPAQSDNLDNEDAWRKVKIIRDEKEADRFREVVLLGRCLNIWKGSLKWLMTMDMKVDEERDKALLHEHLEKWHVKLRKKQDEFQRIGRHHDTYLLRSSFAKWWLRVQTVQIKKWKEDMRNRMSLIRIRRDERIRADAWKKWQQAHWLEVASSFYERHLLRETIRKWSVRVVRIGHLEEVANRFAESLGDARMARLWELWKHLADLRSLERAMRTRVDERLKEDALGKWKQKRAVNCKADALHDRFVVTKYYQAWKRSMAKQRALERKADKYKSRQDGILLLAVFRMWTARERGMLMDRAKSAQLLNNAWSKWKSRLAALRSAEERAIEFQSRPLSALPRAAFTRWCQATLMRRSLLSQAQQYDRDVLMHRTLLLWRVQLRVKLKMAKHAKVARKYLLMHGAWNKWKEMVEEKKRQRLLQVFQSKFLRKFYDKWHAAYAREQYYELALKRFRLAISTRILTYSLRKWTDRVIIVKLRELEVVEKRDDKSLSTCYDKWKIVFKRRTDELRLMQSYQYVKREELLRRVFAKWYSSSKASRHRRELLQEKEEEIKLVILEKAWDQWRERYKANQFRPLEINFVTQSQKTSVYRAYLLWHSKTKSLPAIQFDSLRTKFKVWRKWRQAMPKALLARKARSLEREKVLARALDKWTQAYRTKIALKAVARARYLRLPSGAPRQSVPLSSTLSGVLHSAPSVTSGRATRPDSSALDDRYSERAFSVAEDDSASRAGSTGAPRRRFSALRSTKLSIARPTYASNGTPADSKNALWHELRRIQRKAGSAGG